MYSAIHMKIFALPISVYVCPTCDSEQSTYHAPVASVEFLVIFLIHLF